MAVENFMPTKYNIYKFWEWIKQRLPLQVIRQPWDVQPGQGRRRPTDYPSLVKRYESWVYKCASMNATAVAAVPLRLYIRGTTSRFGTKVLDYRQRQHIGKVANGQAEEIEEVFNHPLLDLLADPNPDQTGIEYRELVTLYAELVGNAYTYVENGVLGIPKALWPLMAQYVEIVPGDRQVKGYLYGKIPTDREAYDAEEVIHYRYPNPLDPWYGLGPTQAAVKAIDQSISMADYRQEFFDNSARLDFAITVPEGTPSAERERLLREWAARYGQKGKRHLPGVLMGDMDIKTFSFSPQDAVLIDQAKFSREEIAAIFGIPMSFLEISAARAEAEAHQYLYAIYTLTPRLRRLEQCFNERLVTRYDNTGRLFLAFDDVVPENVEQAMNQRDRDLRNWTITINQARAGLGMEAVPYGDVPLNYTTGMPILTRPQPSPQTNPAQEIGQRETWCPVCKLHHKTMPEMTVNEKKLYNMAMGWHEGMRTETLRNIDQNMRA